MDLPLSSNYKDIQVFHWILDLACGFSRKQLSGSAFLFCQSKSFLTNSEILQPETVECMNQNVLNNQDNVNHRYSSATTKESDETFNHRFVLDCQDLDIEACYFHTCEDHGLDPVPHFDSSPAASNHPQNSSSNSNQKVKVKIDGACIDKYLEIFSKLKREGIKNQLHFIVEKICVRIFIPPKYFPIREQQKSFVVQIVYKTQEKGASLTWTFDQDFQPCVYTSGHLLNNRTLMPCQDMPEAMSTWHCFISLTADNAKLIKLDKATVLMAGEAEPIIEVDQDGGYLFRYHSSYPMPASTFALAIGTWPQYQDLTGIKDEEKCHLSSHPSVRIFAPPKFHGNALKTLSTYLPSCFDALNIVLGRYPLDRLDILIVPSSFDSLGMMCPHLMFLSQSILVEAIKEAEGGMLYRVAHELCHTWLGVLSGPRDWTEEWLTEGICCYLEDVVHAAACKWNETEAIERLELRCLLKYRVLKGEINTTSEDLQTLRPNADECRTNSTSSTSVIEEPLMIKNGLNPEKTLLQVHYLKGFFLLKHLEHLTGKEEFLQVLRAFISLNLGQLFSSMDLLAFCFEQLPQLRQSDLTLTSVSQEWLDSPGMPQALSNFGVGEGNSLYAEVQRQLSDLKDGACLKRSKQVDTTPRASPESSLGTKRLMPEQRVLLLDLLVEDDVKLTRQQMANLRSFLNIPDATAEVQHGWCELIVLRKALYWLGDVEKFLMEHQAMGVYLYGELMISENARMQALARKVFQSLRKTMAEGQRLAVEEMLHPT